MHRPVVTDSVMIKLPSVSDGSLKKMLSFEGDVIVTLQHCLSLNELEGINGTYHTTPLVTVTGKNHNHGFI